MFFKRFDRVNTARRSENTARIQSGRNVFFIKHENSDNYPVDNSHLKVFLFFKIIHFRNKPSRKDIRPSLWAL